MKVKMALQYCSYCDAGYKPAPGYECPKCGNRLSGPMMTDELRKEISEIESNCREQFENKGRELFGTGFTAKHPR